MRTRPRRPLPALLVTAAAAVVLALTGCGGGSGSGDGAAAAPAPAAASPSDAPAGASDASGAPRQRTVTGMTSFQSPTKNISCYLAPVAGGSPYARCDLARATWTEPEPAGGCSGDWGGVGGGEHASIGVGGDAAKVLCVTDTVIDPGAPELPYGSSITLGPLTCTSQSTGMQCDNADTGHGFTVSRAQHALR